MPYFKSPTILYPTLKNVATLSSATFGAILLVAVLQHLSFPNAHETGFSAFAQLLLPICTHKWLLTYILAACLFTLVPARLWGYGNLTAPVLGSKCLPSSFIVDPKSPASATAPPPGDHNASFPSSQSKLWLFLSSPIRAIKGVTGNLRRRIGDAAALVSPYNSAGEGSLEPEHGTKTAVSSESSMRTVPTSNATDHHPSQSSNSPRGMTVAATAEPILDSVVIVRTPASHDPPPGPRPLAPSRGTQVAIISKPTGDSANHATIQPSSFPASFGPLYASPVSAVPPAAPWRSHRPSRPVTAEPRPPSAPTARPPKPALLLSQNTAEHKPTRAALKPKRARKISDHRREQTTLKFRSEENRKAKRVRQRARKKAKDRAEQLQMAIQCARRGTLSESVQRYFARLLGIPDAAARAAESRARFLTGRIRTWPLQKLPRFDRFAAAIVPSSPTQEWDAPQWRKPVSGRRYSLHKRGTF